MPRRRFRHASTWAVVLGVVACSPARELPSPAPVPVHASTWASFTPAARPTAQPVLGTGTWRSLRVPVFDPGTAGYRAVLVFTPDVADPAALPVLYLLHGLPGRASDLCNPAAGTALDAAFRAGVQPFVLACPDGNPVDSSDSEWADSVDGRDRLETFVTVQARGAVEGSHPRPAAQRAIGGFSMGGFAAASLGLRHPGLYRQVVCLAGYFQLDDPDGVFGSTERDRAEHDPAGLVDGGRGQRWYLIQASDDALALTRHAAEKFVPALQRAHAIVHLSTTPGTHSSDWADAQLPAAAGFLSSGWGAR